MLLSRPRLAAAICAAAVLVAIREPAPAQVVPDMVSRTAFRVCSDPSNLPFSNRKREGFENKIADILANQLKEPIRYFWAPSGPGFVRNTLGSDLCDVVMGYAVGSEIVLSTNPYYRSTYVLVAQKGSALNGIQSIEDPRLKGHKLGVFDATPPVDIMLANGLLTNASLYPLIVDHRFDSPLVSMVNDLQAKKTEAIVVWGPLIGQTVAKSDGALVMTPLVKDVAKPGFAYRISLGIRHDETDWKHKLEAVLRTRRTDINKVLVAYGVPLIDNDGKLIGPAQATGGAGPQLNPASTDHAGRPGTNPKATPPDFQMPGPAPTNGSPPSNGTTTQAPR